MSDVSERIRARKGTLLEGTKPKVTAADKWRPVSVSDLAPGLILSFDQALSKTGWTLVLFDGVRPGIVGGGLLVPKANDLRSFEQTYDRAIQLRTLVNRLMLSLPYAPTQVVYERPAVGGHRTESSLVAGLQVIQASAEHLPGVPIEAVSKQHAAAVLVAPGADRRSKAAIKAAVEGLVPDIYRKTARWNQDVSDSAANAITRLYDLQRERA